LRLGPWLGAALVPLALLVCRCDGNSQAPTGGDETPPEDPSPLLGTWETRGTDAQGREVTARLVLEESGDLNASESLPGGGRLSFPGTWEVSGDSLFLRGAYFQPDGEARVAYAVQGDSVLVLSQGPAGSQQWRRP